MVISCDLQLLLVWKHKNADSTCRKLGERLKRPIRKHWWKKSDRIAAPFILTVSHFQFLLKAQSYPSSQTRTPNFLPYNLTFPKFNLSEYIGVCYSITACFITLLSYIQNFFTAELNPILTQCWGMPFFITLLSSSHFKYFAQLFPILSRCELYPILIHCCRFLQNFVFSQSESSNTSPNSTIEKRNDYITNRQPNSYMNLYGHKLKTMSIKGNLVDQ